MSFDSGSMALTICNLSAELPEDYLSRLAAHSICKLDDVKDEPVSGWAGYRHSQAPVDEAEAICGGHPYFQLIRAERKIPAATFKDVCRRQETAYMQANNGQFCPSKERKRIREEVTERLLMKYPPTITSIPLAISRKARTLYAGTTSTKQLDDLILLFHKSLEVEPVPLSVNGLMGMTCGLEESALPGLSLDGRQVEDPRPGRDFLTWLWYFAEEKGAKLKLGAEGSVEILSFEAMIEGPLSFAAAEAKGALESAVKKGGCPQASAEAKAALQAGKKLKKAKLVIVKDKQVWRGTFDADKLAFSGLALPEGEEMERNARFEERMEALRVLHVALSGYFLTFAKLMVGDERVKLEKDMREWVKNHEAV